MKYGRPTKFCQEVCDTILEALEQGHSEKEACGFANVAYSTYKNWKCDAKDHKTDTPKKCFFNEVEIAKSKGQAKVKGIILKDMTKKDAKWWFEYQLKLQIARDAKEAQDKLIDAQIVEITDEDVEWINNVSNYNQ